MAAVTDGRGFSVAGLFAGIGGIEQGLANHGGHAEFLCEYWEPAYTVLGDRFPDAELVHDVRDVRSLPKVDLVTGGFPCTDLSQAGRTKGITGEQSGLVGEVFRLVKKSKAPLLLLENVRNMLVLDKGTFDAYMLGDDSSVAAYATSVARALHADGIFLLTSCNNTAEELVAHFTSDHDCWGGPSRFAEHDRVKYPTFQFGGVKGAAVATVAFRLVR